MAGIISTVDASAAAAGLSKTSKNNGVIAKQPHIVTMLTIANAPIQGVATPAVLPVIPAPLGTKTPKTTHATMESFAGKLSVIVGSVGSSIQSKKKLSDPAVSAALSGDVPSLGSQENAIDQSAVGSVEFMIQMMQLTAPSKQIEAMQKTMNSQQAVISEKGNKNIDNIQKYYAQMEKASHKSKWGKIFGWVASIATLVVGALVTLVNPYAGIALMVAGSFLLANQIYQQTASKSFQNSTLGKIIGTTLVVGAAVGSVAAAVATGGASLVATGFAVVSVVGQLVTLTLELLQTYDKNFQNWMQSHPDWAIVINSVGPFLSVVGGVGSGFAGGGASAATAAEESTAASSASGVAASDATSASSASGIVADDATSASSASGIVADDATTTSTKMSKLLKAIQASKAGQAFKMSKNTQQMVTKITTAASAVQSGSTAASGGFSLSAAGNTKASGIAHAESQKFQAELKQLDGLQKELNQALSSVIDFSTQLQKIVADIVQSQVQAANEATRFSNI